MPIDVLPTTSFTFFELPPFAALISYASASVDRPNPRLPRPALSIDDIRFVYSINSRGNSVDGAGPLRCCSIGTSAKDRCFVEYVLCLLKSSENDFIPSRIGRYPVQRHRWPSNRSSICCCSGFGLLRRNVIIFITKPGVQ